VKLTASQRAAAARAAQRLGIQVDWLLAVIQNESGGDPKIKNPKSSARGLIQFMDSTARGMGYNSSQDLVNRFPSFESQVEGPVVAYYRSYGPWASRDEFLGTAFYPAYRRGKLDVVLPADVRAANPGYNTLRDYARKVWARYTGVKIVETSFPFALVGIAAWVGWRTWKRKPLLPRLR
jgi:hypothetical protein